MHLIWPGRRRLSVRILGAIACDKLQTPHLFVQAVNDSWRPVEITHIWFATTPKVHVICASRPLPAYLGPDETYEICVDLSALPWAEAIERLGRVRISTGKTFKSQGSREITHPGQEQP